MKPMSLPQPRLTFVWLLVMFACGGAIAGMVQLGQSAASTRPQPQPIVAEAAAPGSSCTYAAVAQEFGAQLSFGLQTAPSAAVESRSASAVQADFAGGTVLDDQPATLTVNGVSSLTKRPTLAFLMQGGRSAIAAGPPGSDVGPLTTQCAVSFYDLTTGEFVINLRVLVPNGQ
jgi:hypothetical protein